MSNNDLYCSKCKTHHHPVECPLDKSSPSEEAEKPKGHYYCICQACGGEVKPPMAGGDWEQRLNDLTSLTTNEGKTWWIEKEEVKDFISSLLSEKEGERK